MTSNSDSPVTPESAGWRRWLRRSDPQQRRIAAIDAALDQALIRLIESDEHTRLAALWRLVDVLRPGRKRQVDHSTLALERLRLLVAEDATARESLREALLWLLVTRRPLHLLAESGVLVQEGLFSGFWRRATNRWLPEEVDTGDLRDCLRQLFPYEHDHLWIAQAPDTAWIALLDALRFDEAAAPPSMQRLPMSIQLLEALQVLSYRIAAIGLEPELVRNHPAIQQYESPFLMQNVELREFLEERKRALAEAREPGIDDRHLLVLLDQCEEIADKVRRQAARGGASVSLTVLLVRLTQHLERLRLLLRLIEHAAPAHALNVLRVAFFKDLVRAENLRDSVREMWRQIIQLLATRITDNASKTGEHYVTATRSEYFSMLRSALGAGFIVAFMAMLKVVLGSSAHSPLMTALLYSLNYGLGFVLIYLLHFTIATKQPAMTASYLAASLATRESGRDRLDPLVDQIVRTLRSQFIAIVGNVTFALAIPIIVALAIKANGLPFFMSAEKAEHLLHDQNPIASLAWLHAAVAGVCLFLSGLISGYFDNKAVYNRIPQRIAQLRSLRRLLGAARLQRFADYIENNLGALAGNFFFGCMLGSMGTLGFIFGLPIDIRHITFSTAYVGYALVALDWQISLQTLLLVGIGVLGIGLINLSVSFGLALRVALRAQRVRFEDRRGLLRRIGRRFIERPGEFFWPPKAAEPKQH
ncbi:site-specific recombinase [Hydrocarboniphaga effusa]|uniref:site-specific recombinase n=1 Tax=Hydrocarboniphaga effusa TaxID=243629 RepID=UPI00398BD573